MQRYRNTSILMLAVCLAASMTGASQAQSCGREVDCTYDALSATDRHTVEAFLRDDCGVGDVAGHALEALVSRGGEVMPYLRAVEAEGLPTALRDQLESDRLASWEALGNFLATDYAWMLGEAAFRDMEAITQAQYVDDEVEKRDRVYRERAAEAIAALVEPSCFGEAPTILGTPGDDTIEGTPGDDVIAGLAGHDEIFGRGGNDVICGGRGRDRIATADGDDRISGGDGADRIDSGSGQDAVFGGRGADRIGGGDGDDILKGEDGRDFIRGDRGDDRLDGGPEVDNLNGGPGADVCVDGERTRSCS